MPEISRFYGIVISMYFVDHPPPHFHAKYGSQAACFDIETLLLLEGKLPARVRGMVIEWASQHQDELRSNWMRARTRESLLSIDPLE
jgi:hypothetical protein